MMWDPLTGREELRKTCRYYIKAHDGALHVEDLLHHLKIEGYLVTSLKKLIPKLGVYVDEAGICRLRAMKNG